MRFLLALCAIGLSVSLLGLYEQIGRYFHARSGEEIARTFQLLIDDPTERRLKEFVPGEKSVAFVRGVLSHNREMSQQVDLITDPEDRAIFMKPFKRIPAL